MRFIDLWAETDIAGLAEQSNACCLGPSGNPDLLRPYHPKMTDTEPDFSSHQYINSLPIIRYDGPIELITKASEAEDVARLLLTQPILGFDTETKPNFIKGEDNPVALLQISTDSLVYLLRVKTTGIPDSLKILLQSPEILKIGVGIKDDLRQLARLGLHDLAGFFDLGKLSQELGYPKTGLRYLAARLLGQRVSKGEQRSNWDAEKLTQNQMIYAATDAWVCLQLYAAFGNGGHLSSAD